MGLIRRSLCLALIMVAGAMPTDSCGFKEGPMFVFSMRPDAPISAYAAGRLGVVLQCFRPSHLVVAYRYLAGRPPSPTEKREIMAYYDARLGDLKRAHVAHKPMDDWMAERNRVMQSDERLSIYRSVDRFSSFPNCTDDAFATAATTLKSRVAEFGVGHPAVRAWVEAQQVVFANCEQGRGEPPAADISLPLVFRHDRAYQIASAAFYATDFDRAHDLFAAIARQEQSPWRRIARVVAARALIRKASLQSAVDVPTLKRAEQELQAIVADKDMSGLTAAANRLIAYIKVRTEPTNRALALASALNDKITYDDLVDSLYLLDHNAEPDDEMTDWIQTFESDGQRALPGEPRYPAPNAAEYAHAIERWRATSSLPWLTAAIANADAASEGVSDLLSAAAKIEPASPAFVTIAYHRARLLLTAGKTAEARTELDRVLSLGDNELGPSSRNLLLALRMPLAESLASFTVDAVRHPAGTDMEAMADPPYEALFDHDAAIVFNQRLPLSALISAARIPKLDDSARAELIAVAFTRAIALGKPGVAVDLVPEMQRDFPEIAARLQRLAASRPADRRVEALDLLLHVPALSPFVVPNEGRIHHSYTKVDELVHSYEHENWWCLSDDETKAPLRPAPFALGAAIRRETEDEQRDLRIAGSGASFILRGAMAWARQKPDDPRVPEALALAINGTRWARPDSSTRALASRAFDVLHKQYGGTQWAKKTRHWYSGAD